MLQIFIGLIGLSIMAMLAAPTVRLAMIPVYSQKQKNNYTLAESQAILVRKQVVTDYARFNANTDITAANLKTSGLDLATTGCTLKDNYVPRQSTMNIPKAVECTVGSGQFQGTSWQPLYTSSNLTESTTTVNPTTYTVQDMAKIGPLCAASLVGVTFASDPSKSNPTVCGVTITKITGKFDSKKVPYFGIATTGEYYLDYSQ